MGEFGGFGRGVKGDHQDYYMFNRESQPKPSFTTVTVRGPHPRFTIIP